MKVYEWISPKGHAVRMSEEKIYELIERWHSDHMLAIWWTLPEYLEMSVEDYSTWVTEPSKFLVEDI